MVSIELIKKHTSLLVGEKIFLSDNELSVHVGHPLRERGKGVRRERLDHLSLLACLYPTHEERLASYGTYIYKGSHLMHEERSVQVLCQGVIHFISKQVRLGLGASYGLFRHVIATSN